MDINVEKLVWTRATEVYDISLGTVLSEALASYKRSPGFDELSRLYCTTAGYWPLGVLAEAMIRRWPNEHVERTELFVEIRSRLRSHIAEFLLRRIVLEGRGTPFLRDALLAVDVGV